MIEEHTGYRRWICSLEKHTVLKKFSETTSLVWTVCPDTVDFSFGIYNADRGNEKTIGGVYISLLHFTLSVDWEYKRKE